MPWPSNGLESCTQSNVPVSSFTLVVVSLGSQRACVMDVRKILWTSWIMRNSTFLRVFLAKQSLIWRIRRSNCHVWSLHINLWKRFEDDDIWSSSIYFFYGSSLRGCWMTTSNLLSETPFQLTLMYLLSFLCFFFFFFLRYKKISIKLLWSLLILISLWSRVWII